jgi:hypothetical protein
MAAATHQGEKGGGCTGSAYVVCVRCGAEFGDRAKRPGQPVVQCALAVRTSALRAKVTCFKRLRVTGWW